MTSTCLLYTSEPEEGELHFGWIRRIIDKLYESGIYTILATPTGAMPNWMTAKSEEVRQMSPEGVRNLPGRRHNFCYTSPIMRKKMKKINHEPVSYTHLYYVIA